MPHTIDCMEREYKRPQGLFVSRVRALLVALLLIGAMPIADAATFTVTKTADTNDGTCDADCSLHEAIVAANASAGPHIIAFNIPIGAGAAIISLGGALPPITRDNVTIDGTTQTTNNGNTNPAVFGTGGTVGVDGLTLSQVNGPEVEIRDAGGLAIGLDVRANTTTIRGLAMLGFGAANGQGAIVVAAGFTGTLVEQNVIGTTAISFTDPGAALRNYSGVESIGGDNGTIQDNVIGFGHRGVFLNNSSNTWTVEGNEIKDHDLASTDGDGVALASSTNNTVRGNLITGSSSQAIVITNSSDTDLENNTLTGNGVGTSTAFAQTAAITLRSTASTTTIDRNIVQANYGAGIQVNDGASGTVITLNSFADNGTIAARSTTAVTDQIGIDLNVSGDNNNLGTPDYYSVNSQIDTLPDFPILDTAVISGGNLTLTGWSKALATIEVFIAAPDPHGFGEGETYIGTFVEGTADGDPSTSNYSGLINGLNQGDDVGASRFSFTVPIASLAAPVVDTDQLTATATLGGETSEFSGVVTVAVDATISGTVFEDVNYGGGAGRDQATSSGIARPGARVELYDAAGAYLTFTTTDASGDYSFAVSNATNYTVRVVNSTVTSSRAGYVPGLLSVQTYRTDASGGSAVPDTARVGGQDPGVADAANGSAGAIMNTTTGVFTAVVTGTAQSITNVSVGAGNVTGLDFGYNFDTIVNANDTGQGSLRQFMDNAIALSNAGLAQVGQTAGDEVSIFMITDGLAHPGLRAGLTNLLSGSGVAVIAPTTQLPVITGANANYTIIDGTTQTTNVGNTNSAVFGVGGTVGVDGLGLSTIAGPEVEVRDGAAVANGFQVQADNVTIKGLAVLGFSSVAGGAVLVQSTADSALIEGNVLGSAATAFADPGPALSHYASIHSVGGTNGIVRNNIIGFGRRGVQLTSTSTGWSIENNEIRDNELVSSDGDGITIRGTSSGNTVTGNLITGSSSQGFAVADTASANNLVNNSLIGNGVGSTTGFSQSTAITMRPGANGTSIDRNVIHANYGAGIQVNDGAIGTVITQNSFADNGTIAGRSTPAVTDQIGIDLNISGDDIDFGTPDYYSVNSQVDTLPDFPILDTAVISGGNLTLTGWSKALATIEVFIAAPDPHGFGEGETYIGTFVEGTADGDPSTSNYSGLINGLNQGDDVGASRFSFTVPIASLAAPVVITDELTATATLGGETSEFSGLVTAAAAPEVSGTVFEDVNYGGGMGRDLATAAADAPSFTVGRGGVTVELYASGNFVTSTASVAGGSYSFTVAPGTYTVRVVNGSVTSSRPGSDGSELAVQTYRIDGVSEAAGDGAKKVGGELPSNENAAANSGAQTLASLQGTDLDSDTITEWTQSIVTVDASGGDVSGVDFGFNFDVVVNTNDSGQGSLRQFIINSNLLAWSGRGQERRIAAVDSLDRW